MWFLETGSVRSTTPNMWSRDDNQRPEVGFISQAEGSVRLCDRCKLPCWRSVGRAPVFPRPVQAFMSPSLFEVSKYRPTYLGT